MLLLLMMLLLIDQHHPGRGRSGGRRQGVPVEGRQVVVVAGALARATAAPAGHAGPRHVVVVVVMGRHGAHPLGQGVEGHGPVAEWGRPGGCGLVLVVVVVVAVDRGPGPVVVLEVGAEARVQDSDVAHRGHCGLDGRSAGQRSGCMV